MQKQIEEETGVKIIFPSSKEDTCVGIIRSCFDLIIFYLSSDLSVVLGYFQFLKVKVLKVLEKHQRRLQMFLNR
jgi:hypothetical protein